jgi:hypothetical protein
VALVHFHPVVLRYFADSQEGRRFSTTIPKVQAELLNDKGFSYTMADRIDETLTGSDYLAVPNFPLSAAIDVLLRHGLELEDQVQSKKQRVAVDERLLQAQAKITPDRSAAAVIDLRDKIEELATQVMVERAVVQQREAARVADVEAAAITASSEFQAFLLTRGGLCRDNLISDEWHGKYPDLASHLFGFRNWTETKAYIWSLFPHIMESKQVPKGVDFRSHSKDRNVSEFEKCILAKMRIHRGYPEKTLGGMFGRDDATVSLFFL